MATKDQLNDSQEPPIQGNSESANPKSQTETLQQSQDTVDASTNTDSKPKPVVRKARRFVGRRSGGAKGTSESNELVKARRAKARARHQIPEEILQDVALNEAIKQLPSNYNFEVHKTVWRLRKAGAKKVALQFPEGLLLFACILSDIFEEFANVETLVMGDVTYGACCVDDYSARALGCDFMVHYGHSCLVPINISNDEEFQVLYVFVDIGIDLEHMVECIKLTFPEKSKKLVVMGTIQFFSAIHSAKQMLDQYYTTPVEVPQARPLSRGEVLGCTSPTLDESQVDALVFVADGRFHLESTMIANDTIPALRYDPYPKKLTREGYDTTKMKAMRFGEIQKAQHAPRSKWGIVLGTLGRQGNPMILRRLEEMLRRKGIDFTVMLLSEMFPAKLALMDDDVDVWVQVACPRLSIDWGTAFNKPLLSPYEAFVACGEAEWREVYPQDFYKKGSGPWTNYYETPNKAN